MDHSRNESSKQRAVKWTGFTIVELLIVVVVIAVLAAITVVSYRGITAAAYEASLKSDLKSATEELARLSLKSRTYPMDDSSLKSSNGNVFSYQSDGTTYCLSAYRESNRGIVFHVTQEQEIQPGGCAPMTTMVSQGGSHTCSLASTGAYCWGSGGFGQLGATKSSPSPYAVVSAAGVLSGKTITAISAGEYYSCAVASGQAYCWGRNTYGQLGDSTLTNSFSPVAVSTTGVLSGKTVTAVSAGQNHACAIASGQLYCWGYNYSGQLGNNTTTDSSSPVAVDTAGVLSGKTVTAVSAGQTHTCAVASGQAYCWGSNSWGSLGTGSGFIIDSAIPVAVVTTGVLSGKVVTAITTGMSHSCVIASGQAYCWGYNGDGQLGTNTTTTFRAPVAVSTAGVLDGKAVTSISAKGSYTCAVASGQAYCWGRNTTGQLGNNSTSGSLLPIAVDTAGALLGKTVTTISAGQGHTCAIASGQLYCWGSGGSGQLGNGTTNSSLTAVPAAAYPE